MPQNTDQSHHLPFIQGAHLQVLPAPKIKRLFAYLLDLSYVSLLLYGFFFILVIVSAIIFGVTASTGLVNQTQVWVHKTFETGDVINSILILILATLFLIVIYALLMGPFHAYFIYYEYKKHTTPGKKIFGLHVISLEDRDLSFKDVVLREVMRHFEFMLVFPPLIAMLATEKSQRLGDLMTGTMVVHTPKDERNQDLLYVDEHIFRQLNDSLRPATELTVEDAQKFLKQAFSIFILKQINLQSDEIFFSKAQSLGDIYYKNSETINFNDPAEKNNFLRFHAQRCFDFINQQ